MDIFSDSDSLEDTSDVCNSTSDSEIVEENHDTSNSNNESENSDSDSDGSTMSSVSWKEEWRIVMGVRFHVIRRRDDLDVDCEAVLFTQDFNPVWTDSFCFGQLRDVDNPPTGWLQSILNFVNAIEIKHKVNLLTFHAFFQNPDDAEEWPLLMVGPVGRYAFTILCKEIKNGTFNDNEVVIYASKKQFKSFLNSLS